MESTNWMQPVTADGNLDVRVGDVWDVKRGPPHIAEVMTLSRGPSQEIACWTEKHGIQVTTIHELGSLASRNGIAWYVPEDKRKGRWVNARHQPFTSDATWYQPGKIDPVEMPAAGMLWLPDGVATPEPVRMDAPPAGERWEHGGLVYLPIFADDGYLQFHRPGKWSSGIDTACNHPNLIGYYFPYDGAIRNSLDPRYQSPNAAVPKRPNKSEPRYSHGDIVLRPSHVVMRKDGE